PTGARSPWRSTSPGRAARPIAMPRSPRWRGRSTTDTASRPASTPTPATARPGRRPPPTKPTENQPTKKGAALRPRPFCRFDDRRSVDGGFGRGLVLDFGFGLGGGAFGRFADVRGGV